MNDELINIYKDRLNLHHAQFLPIEHSEAIIATVFKIIESDNKESILKICPRDTDYFCEVYFLKYFSGHFPVPRLIQVSAPSPDIHGAILMECIPGILLKRENLTDMIAKQIGSLLAKIHANKANGYGDPNQPNHLNAHTADYFTFKFEEGLEECKPILPQVLLNQCRYFYDKYQILLNSVDGPCLTHRDFRPSNIIVNEDNVQGIIDWSSGRASFAEEDFYPIEFGKWSEMTKQSFLEGYASIRPIPNYKKMMPLLGLSHAIATIGFTVRSGTWDNKNADLYRRKRHYLENLIREIS